MEFYAGCCEPDPPLSLPHTLSGVWTSCTNAIR